MPVDLNTLSMILIGFGALFALVTLVYVIRGAFGRQVGEIGGWELRGSGRRIIAVMRATLAEGLRARVASGFALIVLFSVPIFWLTAEGDGTIKGRVQMFMTYALGFTGFILSLMTIFFACRSLSKEIASRQIYSIVSKPVPRWQILAGKWLGVMLFNAVLLAIVGAGTYVGTLLIVREFTDRLEHQLATKGGMTPGQAAETVAALAHVRGIGRKGVESPIVAAMAGAAGLSRNQMADILLKLPEATRVDLRRFDELRRQVLLARASVSPEIPDFTDQVDQKYEEMRKNNSLPATMTEREIKNQLLQSFIGSYRTVRFGEGRTWLLKGPVPEDRDDFFMGVRFKIVVAATMPPFLDAETGMTLEKDTLLCAWGVGDPRSSNYAELLDTQPINSFKEFEIPVNCVESDGTIRLTFGNVDPRRKDAVFNFPDGLQVLYRVGSFEMNLFQACLAILVPLACLASLGLCASTFLSFPVGSLILVCLYLIALSMGFVAESLAVTDEYAPPDPGTAYLLRRLVVESLDVILAIGDLNPTDALIEGRAVDWSLPSWRLTSWNVYLSRWPFALAKSALVLMVAVLVFRRRELAAVIV